MDSAAKRETSAPSSFLPISPAFPPELRYRLRPKLGRTAQGGGQGLGALPRLGPFPPAYPTRRLRPLPLALLAPDITPREAGSGKGGECGEEALHHRERGGRARSPSPELPNSPAASPRAPAHRSVQPPAPGEWGSRSGAARARRGGSGQRAPGQRGHGPCTHWTQGVPCNLSGGREGAPSLSRIRFSSSR